MNKFKESMSQELSSEVFPFLLSCLLVPGGAGRGGGARERFEVENGPQRFLVRLFHAFPFHSPSLLLSSNRTFFFGVVSGGLKPSSKASPHFLQRHHGMSSSISCPS